MMENNTTRSHLSARGRWLRRLWALLPTLTFFLLVGVIVVLVGTIQTQGNALKEQKVKEMRHDLTPTNVVALDVEPGLVQERLSLPGVVRPWIEIKAVAEVNGMITDKRVVKGQSVKKGDILAVIDDRDYQNSYASAQAAYKTAESTFQRLTTLLRNKAAAQAQVDEARAQLEVTKATMANAMLRLDRTIIRSPLAGVVDETYIENGQYVTPGNQVAKILQIDRVKVEVGIPESDVDAVRRVKDFTVTIDALDGKVYKGQYHFLSRSAQSMARLYNLEVAVDNPRGEILPDMFTRVDIVKKSVPDGLAIPLFSLIPRQKGTNAIYLVENGLARLREVEIGIQEGWRVQVTKGLEAGDQVIVVGHRSVNDGAPLKVVRTVRSMEELNQ